MLGNKDLKRLKRPMFQIETSTSYPDG